MTYPTAFLDELRARVPVSEVVSRHGVKLTKAGAEFKGLSPFNKERTPSFTVNDGKGFYHCFSSSKHGDVFGFIEETTGCDFVEAVKQVASIAGLAVPNGEYKAKANGSHAPSSAPEERAAATKGKQEIVATYDFLSLDGDLLYQEVRFQIKLPNGNWEMKEAGKPKKSIRQRRPDPDKKGEWIWNLEGVAHGLYDFPAIREEMLLPEDERSTVFLPEGPAKCEAFKAWGVLATSNSGGAAHWLPHHVAEFAGADVVICIDNDDPGRKRGQAVAASLWGVAKLIRILDFSKWWAECPEKGDVIDWRDRGGGTKEKLFQIVDKLPTWSPEPYKSKFGAITFHEVGAKRQPYRYLIKNFLPAAERSMVFGAPGSGKSFVTEDIGLSIAREKDYAGLKTTKAGVIYCAFEGGKGFATRVDGYRQYHDVGPEEDVPFVMLTKSVDIFEDTEGRKALRIEIDYWASTFSVPLGLVIFDTVSASGGSMDDSQGKDVARYLANGKEIVAGLSCATLYVHHIPKNGGNSPRGSGKWTGDLEATIEVHDDPHGNTDDSGRPIRVVHLRKLREEQGNREIKRFVLRQYEVAKDDHGDPIYTCILLSPGATMEDAKGKKGFHPRPQEAKVFAALLAALEKHGTMPPPALAIPSGKVVTYQQWRDAYEATDIIDDEEDSKRASRVKMAMKRAGESLMKFKIVGRHAVDRNTQYFWYCGVPVRGFPSTYPKPKVVGPAPDDVGNVDF